VRYYAKDHLGSVVQVVDNSGKVLGTQTFNVYGQRTQNSGIIPMLGYAGMQQHAPSALNLT
jgi:hypothetical protein